MLHLFLVSLSVHSSGSGRISPPASEFDLEGVGIIDLALDKYSKKKADSSAVTDKDLISKEALATHSPDRRGRDPGSVSSMSSTSVPDTEATAGSYGAMLRDYTKRNKPQESAGVSVVQGYVPDNQQSEGNGEGSGGNHRNGYDLNLALSLNYEVSFVLYYIRVLAHSHSMRFLSRLSYTCWSSIFYAIVCVNRLLVKMARCSTHRRRYSR